MEHEVENNNHHSSKAHISNWISKLISWHNLHHLLMAAVIASCTLMLEGTGSIDWLDAVTLRLAIAAKTVATNDGTKLKGDSSIANTPHTLLIDDRLYENYFKQASPLGREQLTALIQQVVIQKPALLAFDLDLSPGADDPKGMSKGQQDLDRFLDVIARNGCESKPTAENIHDCKVILTMPMPVTSENLQRLQFDWMKKRCEAGIQFATPKLLSHQGTITHQSPSSPTLGNVAAWWFQSNDGHAYVTNKEGHQAESSENGDEHGHPNYDYFCQNISEYSSAKDYLVWMRLDPANNVADEELVPINTDYFSTPGNGFENKTEISNMNGVQTPVVLPIAMVSKRAVFIGGGYGVSDKFSTATGTFDGVSLHAANFLQCTA